MSRRVRIDPIMVLAVIVLVALLIGLAWRYRDREDRETACTAAGGVLVQGARMGYECVAPVRPATTRKSRTT